MAILIFQLFMWGILKAQEPIISSPLTMSGTVGLVIPGYTITASNLPTSFGASNLPSGLTFDPAVGSITGTPEEAGTFNATISATNNSGTDAKTLVLTIAPGNQAITGLPLTDVRTYGDANYILDATSSSGLPVVYSSSNTSVAAISGNTVVIAGSGIATITASQAGNSNYNAATDILQTLTIDKKLLSVGGTTIAPKIYDGGNESGSVMLGMINGFVGTETLSATARGWYQDPNAGIAKPATVMYTLENGTNGGVAANYTLQNEIIIGDIIQKTLSISGTGISPKIYDGNAVSGAVSIGSITGFIGSETLEATAAGSFTDASAANGKTAVIIYTLGNGTNGGIAANYILPNETGTGDILPKHLSITETFIAPKIYDARPVTGAVMVGVISGFEGAETVTATGSGIYADPAAGINKSAIITYTLANGSNGGVAANYSLAGETITGSILSQELTIAGTTITPKTYDGSPATGTILPGIISGLIGNETITVTASGIFADANAGNNKPAVVTYTLGNGANGGLAANYTLANEVLTGAILPKELSITGTTIDPKIYDGSAVTGKVNIGTITGFVGNETIIASSSAIYADANAGTGKLASVTYILTNGTNGGLAANYVVANDTTRGDILPAALAISGTKIAPKRYDGSPVSGVVSVGMLVGFIGNETVTATGMGLFNDANTENAKPAIVSYTLSNGSNGGLAANYQLANDTVPGDIIPGILTISGTMIAPKVYDGNSISGTITIGTISGLAGTETITVTATALYNNPAAGNGKIALVTYSLANGTNGGLAANYILESENVTGNIIPKPLTVAGSVIASKVYDARTSSSVTVGTVTGFVGAETVTATATGMYVNANAGNSKTATIMYTLANGTNGGLATNYNLEDETKSGNITPAPLKISVLVDTVKCSAENITFDNTRYSISGLVDNERVAAITLSPSGSPANDPIGVGVHTRYIGVASTTSLATTTPTVFMPANYTISVDSGKLTINKTPALVAQSDTTCSNVAFVFSPVNSNGNDFPTGTTYSWPAPTGTGFSGGVPGTNQPSIAGMLSNVTSNNIVTATYRVVPKSGNCIGDTFTLLIKIKHLPSRPQIVPIPAVVQFCQNSNQNFTAGIANTFSSSSTVNDVVYQWSTDAILVATSTQSNPKGKNAVVRFPGAGPYTIKVTDSVLEVNGCSNDSTIIINPAGQGGNVSNVIIYNGKDFVCLNNNVNAAIDGYQWGYDSKELVPNNYTTADALFVTAQNLTRPITDTATRYVWVITRSGSCSVKTYFNVPHGRPLIVPPILISQTAPVKIFPNPAKNEAVITWKFAAITDPVRITITDITGRKVLIKQIPSGAFPGRAIVNVAALAKGIYLVQVSMNSLPAAVGKLVKE